MKNQIIKEHLKNFDMNLLFKRKTEISLKNVSFFRLRQLKKTHKKLIS